MVTNVFWWKDNGLLRGRFGDKWSFTIDEEKDFDTGNVVFCLIAFYTKGVDSMFFDKTFDTIGKAKGKATLLVKKFF